MPVDLPNFETIHQFHFLRPEALLGLIPLLLIWLVIRSQAKAQSGWTSVLPEHLLNHLVSGTEKTNNKPPFWLLALGWLLATIALAGPTWERLPQPVYQLAAGKVLVMDMSLSMFATDVKPDRLTRARFKAIDLVNAIEEGEIGLIAYAGDAFVISPLSTDSQNLTTLIPSLSPDIMPEPGSDPYLAIEKAIDLLRNAGHIEGEIFVVTDGVAFSQVQDILTLLRPTKYRLSILAVGTESGAPIKLPNGELLKDRKGAIVIPRLEQTSLKTLAESGRYIAMRSDEKDIEYLLSGVDVDRDSSKQHNENDDENQSFGDQWKETGPYILLLLLPIAAYAFRRGLILALPLTLPLMLLLQPQQAQAEDWWTDLWQTKDQQAQDAFNEQAFNKAADQFQHQQWKASSAYKAGDYETALQGFKNDNSANGLYNQGNALANLNDIDGAISAYQQALQKQPDFAEAKANLELLKMLKEQQQNQSDQDQSEQNQDQQNSEQQQNEQQESQENKQQDQNNSENRKQNQQQSNQQSEESTEQSEQEQNQQQQDQQESAEETEEQSEQESQQAEKSAEEEAQNESEQQPVDQRELTQEELEQQQKLEQWLRKVPDDPSLLLRNKMRLEYQQRRMHRLPNQRKVPGSEQEW